MAPTILFDTYCVLVQQDLLFNFSKCLLLKSHFGVRSLHVQTIFVFSISLKNIGEA